MFELLFAMISVHVVVGVDVHAIGAAYLVTIHFGAFWVCSALPSRSRSITT